MAKPPKPLQPSKRPAKVARAAKKTTSGKSVAAIREKFKKAMEDPDFSARMARHVQELLRQGRDP